MTLKFVNRAVVAAMLIGLSACTQPTGLLNVATSPAEDRSFDALKSDTQIALDINDVLLGEKYRDLFFDISTDVYDGRVMLTGTVKTPADRQRATELVRQVKGVKDLYNDLQVATDYSTSQQASDLWIETRLKGEMIGAKGVHSINYRWRSVRGVVYLIGTARTPDEMKRAIAVIRGTPHVKDVVNHAWVLPAKKGTS